MKTNRPYQFLLKIIIFALIMSGIPLPTILLLASPFWILIFYVYWIIFFTAKGRLFLALIIGLLIDILHGSLLGQNALALILSSAFIINVKQSFYVSNISTQQIYVFAASAIYLLTFLLIHILIQGLDFSWIVLLVPLTTSLFWQPVKFILTKLRH
ncbi:MAG: rod shape-determining protein MreD [PS1 clade bacterium]|jgi:rod shape-determining protein MreD